MTQRASMLAAGALGLLWAGGVVWAGVVLIEVPIFALLPTLATAFIGPGIVIAALVLAMSMRRILDDTLADGDEPPPFSGAEIDARVLANTLEQLVIALCLWPPTAYLATAAGPGLVAALGLAFVPARLAYWLGYRVHPPLRMFGFTATFFATLLAFGYAVAAAFGLAAGLAAG
jgi:uncharacterized membrane protein YecN with MAPEG domain